MQIDNYHPPFIQRLDRSRITDLGLALHSAKLYYDLTGDTTLIDDIIEYIRTNDVDVNVNGGMLLRDATLLGDPFKNFVQFLTVERNADPLI